jgi:hypothetical protein
MLVLSHLFSALFYDAAQFITSFVLPLQFVNCLSNTTAGGLSIYFFLVNNHGAEWQSEDYLPEPTPNPEKVRLRKMGYCLPKMSFHPIIWSR